MKSSPAARADAEMTLDRDPALMAGPANNEYKRQLTQPTCRGLSCGRVESIVVGLSCGRIGLHGMGRDLVVDC